MADARQRLANDAQHIADQTSLRSSTPMSYLSAPVPDYASSLLTTRASDAADEANTTVLRESLSAMSAAPARTSSVDHSRDPRLGITRRHHNPNRGTSPTQRDRLQRYLTHLYRMHNPPAPVAAAYSNRTPSPTRQSIYDWAPATSEDTSARNAREARTENTITSRTSGRLEGHSDTASHRSNSSRERNWRLWRSESQQAPTRYSQQHHEDGFNGSESMLRYFMDRDRSGLSEEEERARGAGWYRPNLPPRATDSESWLREDSWSTSAGERSRQERMDALRREYLSAGLPSRMSGDPSRTRSSAGACGGSVESAVKYLDSLRHCNCYDDALAAAIDLNLTTKDLFASKHDEFLLDIEEVEPLSHTSWLQPGAVFEGHQFASTAILPRAQQPSTTNDHPPGSTQFTAYRNPHTNTRSGSAPRSGSLLARMAASNYDYWPVRMLIHTVDPATMNLQGSMEAYDVPQHPLTLDATRTGSQLKAGKKNAPITTYVEGHIIDFHNYSFVTPRADPKAARAAPTDTAIFPAATPSKDAENWRKLPPFNELSEDDMTELLLSKDRLDVLNKEFIFMRWKERCFVHGKHDTCSDSERRSDHDRGHGLTISGFYYISLRRSDGSVEGIYFDPHSTPYQHLRLKGMKATWPSWQFR